MITTFPIKVCKYCKSDLIVYLNKQKRIVKCLKCGKKGREETIWIIKMQSNGNGRITRIIDEQGYVLKEFTNNKEG